MRGARFMPLSRLVAAAHEDFEGVYNGFRSYPRANRDALPPGGAPGSWAPCSMPQLRK